MSENGVGRLHHRLDVLDLCVKISELPTEDAPVLKAAQATLEEALQTKREIDELIQRYEQLKKEEDALVSQVELRLGLAELMKAFLDGLLPSTPGSVAEGESTDGPADLPRVDAKGPQDIKHIAFLTSEEFTRVPKYVSGRFTISELDELVISFNEAPWTPSTNCWRCPSPA
ncbi:hypothetical protein HPB48_015212 [Haemaphysalis longicornis]|uniref:SKA complex subunit 1 n=1 Tax=Haemaphysalis longicornis TaxID=44386 RepID=A0A9J6FKB0_HAELO|nr:hypothetical protein HPB48_015212 [Haemaphysalis longicornis]